jgi:hypothetical protein
VAARLRPEIAEALSPAARVWCDALGGGGWAEDFYLAGGAGLALYLGHRAAVADLDLMSGTARLAPQERRDLLSHLVARDPDLRVETARDGYLFARRGDGGALRFFSYPYPLVDPEERFAAGVPVASAVDLGLMKLAALISRASRRDYVDLWALCQRLALDEILARAGDKFGHVRDFSLQAAKALADTADAEGEPMPRLAQPIDWREVSTWARAEAARLGRAVVEAR